MPKFYDKRNAKPRSKTGGNDPKNMPLILLVTKLRFGVTLLRFGVTLLRFGVTPLRFGVTGDPEKTREIKAFLTPIFRISY